MSFNRWRTGPVLAAVVLTASVAAIAPPASADRANDPRIAVAQTTQALRGTTATTTIEVPAGLVPKRLSGRVSREDADLAAEISIDGTVVHTAAAPNSDVFDVPVPERVAGDTSFEVGLRYREPRSDEYCPPLQPSSATLSDLVVSYQGHASLPTTVADFWPVVSPQVLVQVPAAADSAVAEAGLAAVAALAQRYPADTVIRMVDASQPLPAWSTGARVVRLVEGSEPVEAKVGSDGDWPMLTLTGDNGLSAAAAALADPALGLANSASVTGLGLEGKPPSAAVRKGELRRTLADLVASDRLELAGYGTTARFLNLPQDMFGGPVDQLRLNLHGTHTAVPEGGRVQLDVLANDFLVDSIAFDSDDESGFAVDASIPASALRGANGLELRMSAVPAGGDCADLRSMPVEVHVDLDESTLTGRRGNGSVEGFARFPQVLAGQLPIALRGEGVQYDANLARAAAVVVALQRAAVQPLQVRLVEPAQLIDSDDSGLLVGADSKDAERLDAPLRLAEVRLMTYADATFQTLSGSAFAALEAFHQGGRDLLLLGGWGSDDEAQGVLQDRLIDHLGEESWSALADDVLVSTGEAEPFVLDSNAVIPQEDRVDARRSSALWFVLALVVLLMLVGLNLWLARRRRQRITELVDAQVAAEAAPDSADSDQRP